MQINAYVSMHMNKLQQLTNQAKEKNNRNDYSNRPTVLHLVLRSLKLSLNSTTPSIEMLVIAFIRTIEATFTSFVACIVSLFSIKNKIQKHNVSNSTNAIKITQGSFNDEQNNKSRIRTHPIQFSHWN